jgi:hypothetical protein
VLALAGVALRMALMETNTKSGQQDCYFHRGTLLLVTLPTDAIIRERVDSLHNVKVAELCRNLEDIEYKKKINKRIDEQLGK